MATDADAARKRADADGIEFVFAQFVDMNAKPSAKLVPITNWDSMVSEGAGFAGFAAGPIGQTPASPDMMAVPDLDVVYGGAVQAGLGSLRVRYYGGG